MKPSDEARFEKLVKTNPAKSIAEMTGIYFESLLEHGMSKAQAYDLTREFNVYLLGNAFGWRVISDEDERDWWVGSDAD